jgi:hypothetical protein
MLSAILFAAFQFSVPPGWTKLAPDVPPSELAKVPPVLVEQAKGGRFAFFAADLAGPDDGFIENVNVLIDPGATAITSTFLKQVVDSIGDEVKKSGAQYRVVESGLTKVNGVSVGRYVGELTMAGVTVKQIGYLMPGKNQHAILTYSTTREKFSEYQPIFDKAAQATLGVEEPSIFNDASSPIRWQSLLATAAAIAALVIYSIVAQRRRAK